jgi:hypothetical protein
VSGSGRGRVQDSVVRHNGLHGVVVQDDGRIDLVRNSVVENGGFGILFVGRSGGSVQTNEIARNDEGGLVTPMRDTVVVDGNTLRDNGRLGALPAIGRFPAP